jgi:thiosulfate dehydrogenase
MLQVLRRHWPPLLIMITVAAVVAGEVFRSENTAHVPIAVTDSLQWQVPSLETLGDDSSASLVRYGRELIIHTADYLGPAGSVTHLSNGMNCQNCHLDAGTRPWGNALITAAATYPVYRPRSGRIETLSFRINDCMQRSLNGRPLDSNSHEMKAMLAYLHWLGKEIPKHQKPAGVGLATLPLLERPADSARGRVIYNSQCARCHGNSGEGLSQPDHNGYAYPPLWGENSFNTGAGLYRISRMAAFVKFNMPFAQSTHDAPVLSDEEAWDVAAFINSCSRPDKDWSHDWPKLSEKAFDYPKGPFYDSFPATQHKYGPFAALQHSAAHK